MRYRMPLVLLNRIGPKSGASSVLCDNVGGARDMVRFLLAGGHSRIAYIGGRPGSAISQDRERGMREAFEAAGRKTLRRAGSAISPSRAAGRPRMN